MDIQAYKSGLVEQIKAVQNENILRLLGDFLAELTSSTSEKQGDWWNELTEAQQASALRGLEQAKNGETISYEEMRKDIDDLFGK